MSIDLGRIVGDDFLDVEKMDNVIPYLVDGIYNSASNIDDDKLAIDSQSSSLDKNEINNLVFGEGQ